MEPAADKVFLTRPDAFTDVSRGNPKPHTLRGAALVEARLTPESWRLEIVSDGSAQLEKPSSLADGTALDLPALERLGRRHGVKFLKAMQCLNIAQPLGQGLWEGVPLREVLKLVGKVNNVRRIYYHGFHNNDPAQRFQSSLGYNQVMETPPWDLPVFVAYRLNGGPLPLIRGGPVRMAALGLSAAQAQRVFAKAIVGDGRLDDRDIDLVTEEKKQIIRESKALEFYSVTQTPDDVGGLDVLKDWLRLRERAFTEEARAYGLPAPKGIALIGIPGTGKSLTAKMIGGLWRIPLLRLDVGALYGSLMGESEERARRALRLAETVSPCLLWIDEIEKSMAHGEHDSGTSTRVFGTILTWMQEKTAPCFVVATANNISNLPPELLRKGRFDEIFFLDLPTVEERRQIFTVHLRKRNRLPGDFDVDRLARLAEGYVGAEIEQAVIDAMYVGFNAGREFTTDDVAAALRRQVPLSVSQRETVEDLRMWLSEGRAQSASLRLAEEAEPGLGEPAT